MLGFVLSSCLVLVFAFIAVLVLFYLVSPLSCVGARTGQNGRQQIGAEFIGDFRLIQMLLLLVGQIICNWYAWLRYKAARRSQ